MPMVLPLLVLLLVHVASAAAAASHLLLHYRRPATAVAWAFPILLLPLLGALAYAVLAMYQGPRSLRDRRGAATEIREARAPDVGDAPYRDRRPRSFARLMSRTCSFRLLEGNSVDVLADDHDALVRQLDALRGARREILLQTYVLKDDGVTRALFEVLAERAAAGVDVRVLFDPIGSNAMREGPLRELRARGVRATTFLKPNPLKGRLQVNFRNHRKILAIDRGQVFTGGRNWSNEYYSGFGNDSVFRDLTLALRGPAVRDVCRMFDEDWTVTTGDRSDLDRGDETPAEVGSVPVRVVPGGADEPRDELVAVIGGAFRAAAQSITIVTPYFVPGPGLTQALSLAALSGVDVRVLTTLKSGYRSIDLAARYYARQLAPAGVRVYRRPPPLLHSKAVLIDGAWATVGSVNFDARSFHLNYELNLEIVDSAVVGELERCFADDFDRAELLRFDADPLAGRRARVAEKTAALFGPVL